MTPKVKAIGASALYLLAVVLPNYLIAQFGVVDVVPGPWVLMAPAAVYAVGLALVARDVVDDVTGRVWYVFALIGVGTVLSVALAGPKIAVASGAAFVLSETLDLGIYRALRDDGWAFAALISSYAGAALDSLVFLWLADAAIPGPMFDFLPGQWVGKVVSITVVVLVFAPLRRYWTTRKDQAGEPVVA